MMTNRHYFNLMKRKKSGGPSAAVLQYDSENVRQLSVIGSAKGELAQLILETAIDNDMPIQKDSTLVANLLDTELAGVPPQLYAVMAEIFQLLEKVDQKY
ncbi:EscU/YscU/HrcU family type III secretion system export apparatus switch protein [Bacillus benzoevorans]|uniref:Flagellar biosynthesis protein n=2 Tax=Bacillus benzoevorans TaxID=1456 RepID=A0A7X0HR06_9BACI|nr:flagellar biosynthesis protein FlhS [Bacillus benzoevorans]MBB6445141.1 flagellar biosynthesis protein [Bacillus benzoevorans]